MDKMPPDVLTDRQPAAATPSMAPDVLTSRVIGLDNRLNVVEHRVHVMDWRSLIITIITAAIASAGTSAVMLG